MARGDRVPIPFHLSDPARARLTALALRHDVPLATLILRRSMLHAEAIGAQVPDEAWPSVMDGVATRLVRVGSARDGALPRVGVLATPLQLRILEECARAVRRSPGEVLMLAMMRGVDPSQGRESATGVPVRDGWTVDETSPPEPTAAADEPSPAGAVSPGSPEAARRGCSCELPSSEAPSTGREPDAGLRVNPGCPMHGLPS